MLTKRLFMKPLMILIVLFMAARLFIRFRPKYIRGGKE
jgi:hypothetical protein